MGTKICLGGLSQSSDRSYNADLSVYRINLRVIDFVFVHLPIKQFRDLRPMSNHWQNDISTSILEIRRGENRRSPEQSLIYY